MEVKKIACPSCGASIDVDMNKKTGKCSYCHSSYAIDDGIIRVEYSFADEEGKRQIANANVALYKFKDYDKSLSLFIKLYNKYQDNCDFLLGIILSLSHDFTKQDYTIKQGESVLQYWNLFIKIGSESDIKKYQKDIDNIQSIISQKDAELKYYKKVTLIVVLVSLGVFILYFIVKFIYLYTVKPKPKKVTIYSSNQYNANDLIKYSKLDCDKLSYEKYGEGTIEYEFKCENKYQGAKKYKFTYEFKDNEAPYIKDKSCEFYEYEEKNIKCFRVYDKVDGTIEEYEVDSSEVVLDKPGETYIKVKAKDKSGNELDTTVPIVIIPTPIRSVKLNISGSDYRVGGTAKASTVILPDSIKDKSVTYTSSNNEVATIDANGNIKFVKSGSANICATSVYDSNKKDCKDIEVSIACKSTYVFNLDPSSSNKLYAEEDYCPGTYRIYAPSVLNYDDFYYIHINYSGSITDFDSMTVWKKSSYLNDEGKKYALGASSSIEVPAGVKQLKLVKTS